MGKQKFHSESVGRIVGHNFGYGTRAPSDVAMARKTRRRKWFHFGQRYGTIRNDT